MTRWYEDAFDADYVALYPHRDEEEARQDVASIERFLRLERNAPLLDLACGAGRHLAAWRDAGFTTLTGMDLSEALLALARRRLSAPPEVPVRLICGDMREIPFRDEFSVVLSLFTSFGYFEEEDDDLRVLRSAFAALRPGGALLLDLMNPARVSATLIEDEEKDIGSLRVAIHRSFDPAGRRVEKEMTYVSPTLGPRTVRESVRLYRPDEIDRLLGRAGFETVRVCGSLRGAPLRPASRRLVAVARKGVS